MIVQLDEFHSSDTKKFTIFNTKYPDREPWLKFSCKEDYNLFVKNHFISDNRNLNELCQLLLVGVIY